MIYDEDADDNNLNKKPKSKIVSLIQHGVIGRPLGTSETMLRLETLGLPPNQ